MESKAEEDLPHVNSNRDTQGASDALTADNNTLHRRTSLPVTIRNDNLCCDTNKPSFTANEIAIDQFVSKEQKIKVKVSKQLPPDLEPRARCKEEQREAGHFLKERQDISWKAKAVVLFSMLIMPVGCHYMEATLGTLKTTLKHSMNINNTQFSILMSAVSVVNTVLPFFAGAFADDFNSSIGTVRGTLATSMVIFVGSLLVSVAVNNNNYPMMLAGQVIYGLGDGVIVTFQEAILSRWFRNKQLSIVVGIMLSVARLTKFIAKAVCYPLADYAGTTTRPVTVAMILCALSVVANMAYWCVMVKQDFATLLGKEKHIGTKRYKRLKQDAFHYSTLLYLPSTFWMMPWLQFTMSSVLSSFTDIATEFVQFRFKTTRVKAGYVSSLTQLAPIVLAPLLGLYAHRYGKRL
ncbi:major facilitator superfamily domain-containing protein, partial [Mycotypha africana]|uniref:major facilitator superfamily domain-containing protein n=1 Tax=Mycotypha africana TaxID=64632 RepID=UPI0023003EF8